MSKAPALPNDPFRARDALAAGVSAHRLRGRDLDRSFWGLRQVAPATTLLDRCRLLAVRMPELAVFSHATAAGLHLVPLPRSVEVDQRLHVAVPAPARAPHANGSRGHQLRLSEQDIRSVLGIRVTSPARTWCDLTGTLPLLDLVAAGDFLIHWRRPLTSKDQLQEYVWERVGLRGASKLRAALELLDDRSESPAESRIRAILRLNGAPDIRVNHNVTDGFGEFVARTDLWIEDWNLVLEYQGDYHRTTPGQWRSDMSRRSRLEAVGRRVMELNADDLRDPGELTQRIRRRVALPY